MSPHICATHHPKCPPKNLTFHSFPKLPPEIRLKIWDETISHRFVKIFWAPHDRVFYPRSEVTQTPSLLHVCRESRYHGLKYYELAFAPSKEFARVYFAFDLDTLYIDWKSLGGGPRRPGRLGRKICVEECARVQGLMFTEETLLAHAMEDCGELSRFTAIHSICIICDPSDTSVGRQYGFEIVAEIEDEIDEGLMEIGLDNGTERWPLLICVRELWDPFDCSKHWWIEGWNERATIKQREKWPSAIARYLESTEWDRDGYFGADFLFNMLDMQAMI